MFAKTITESDAFLDMPLSSQCLYFHLGMVADDDGFVNAPKKIQRMIGASSDDLKLLIAKKFLLPFESGVVVIKHWKMNNYLRNDRYKKTVYQEEKALLKTNENGSYSIGIPGGIPTVYPGQDRLGKDSIVKDNDDYINNKLINKLTNFEKAELEAECKNRGFTLESLIRSAEYCNKDGISNVYGYLKKMLQDERWK